MLNNFLELKFFTECVCVGAGQSKILVIFRKMHIYNIIQP